MLQSDSVTALVLDPADNVATLLTDAEAGVAVALTNAEGGIRTREAIRFGHKIARREICPGEPIVKYGQAIGNATTRIQAGDWVHLHNMASVLDAGFRKRVAS